MRSAPTENGKKVFRMAEYIEREEIYRRWNAMPAPASIASLSAAIQQTPAADVTPVRHGRWIKRGYACGENEYECSVCHETEWRTSASRMKYCMFCGAKMNGGESNG